MGKNKLKLLDFRENFQYPKWIIWDGDNFDSKFHTNSIYIWNLNAVRWYHFNCFSTYNEFVKDLFI